MKMHTMHMDAPFSKVGGHEKIFFVLRMGLGVFWVHSGASALFWRIFGTFSSIFSYLLVFRMHQMHMDEPLASFWRFSVSPSFGLVQTMHPCQGGKVHPCAFSSLKKEG